MTLGGGMTVYYSSIQPIFYSLSVVSRTLNIFGMVCRRLEFWVFLTLHCIFVILTMTGALDTKEFDHAEYEALAGSQFFMTFFLVFYNDHCYKRFHKLYDLCMLSIDSALLFTQELVVAFPHPELDEHKLQAVKYVMAMVWIYFMGTTGGKLQKAEWKEVTRKGLLTKAEAEQLREFPHKQSESILILGSWAMQVVDTALAHDCMWRERSMRIAHTHNRLNAQCENIITALHEIGAIMALPVPYPYFHTMNVLLGLNLFTLTVFGAFFKTYMTVFPLGVALIFFLGLREVSNALADPFGQDDVDFPIAAFLQYAFDTAACVLESFANPKAVNVKAILANHTEFTNAQLRRQVKPTIMYPKAGDPTAVLYPFAWSRDMPMHTLAGMTAGPSFVLRHIVVAGPVRPDDAGTDSDDYDSEEEEEEERQEQERKAKARKGKKKKFDKKKELEKKNTATFGAKEEEPKKKHKKKPPTKAEKARQELKEVQKETEALEKELEIMQEHLARLTEEVNKHAVRSEDDANGEEEAAQDPNEEVLDSPRMTPRLEEHYDAALDLLRQSKTFDRSAPEGPEAQLATLILSTRKPLKDETGELTNELPQLTAGSLTGPPRRVPGGIELANIETSVVPAPDPMGLKSQGDDPPVYPVGGQAFKRIHDDEAARTFEERPFPLPKPVKPHETPPAIEYRNAPLPQVNRTWAELRSGTLNLPHVEPRRRDDGEESDPEEGHI
eukprot:gnl/TRDRNA2_/TRDRNA2_35231_c0_seq1.p1 gnl/TRDRNA2_/TRDRNA2_35231_c0~~gnl/TRDRNA2_/TRDRNA2_35231_c0_seq1.p1  ORF type:complete len:726 (+),score=145.03 gnl/TRDRNA2_/TRDRNA2_35231_c0_seq1:185-2362(+)